MNLDKPRYKNNLISYIKRNDAVNQRNQFLIDSLCPVHTNWATLTKWGLGFSNLSITLWKHFENTNFSHLASIFHQTGFYLVRSWGLYIQYIWATNFKSCLVKPLLNMFNVLKKANKTCVQSLIIKACGSFWIIKDTSQREFVHMHLLASLSSL